MTQVRHINLAWVDDEGPIVYFVMERANGRWSPGAKVIETFSTEDAAEMAASQIKRKFPQRNFGVAVLRSEAREVAQPIEIFRLEARA